MKKKKLSKKNFSLLAEAETDVKIEAKMFLIFNFFKTNFLYMIL